MYMVNNTVSSLSYLIDSKFKSRRVQFFISFRHRDNMYNSVILRKYQYFPRRPRFFIYCTFDFKSSLWFIWLLFGYISNRFHRKSSVNFSLMLLNSLVLHMKKNICQQLDTLKLKHSQCSLHSTFWFIKWTNRQRWLPLFTEYNCYN